MINPLCSNDTAANYMRKERNCVLKESETVQNQKNDTLEIGTSKHIGNLTYSKPIAKKPDANEIQKLWETTDKATQAIRDLVEKLILNQRKNSGVAENDSAITIDAKTKAEANKAISENGVWGVKAVSSRIVAFAKAISGGDKSRLDEIKSAIEAGFTEAERILGGALPEISQKTYNEVMKQLDQWANEA